MVVDAVAIEPVSSPKFPANREKNREFYQIRPSGEISSANTQAIPRPFSQIPYTIEQGINLLEQGILAREQGFLPAKTEIAPDEVFGTHRVAAERDNNTDLRP